jgi:hypothetical protein
MACNVRVIRGSGVRLRRSGVPTWVRLCAALGLTTSASCALLPVAGGMGDCSGALLARTDPNGAACLERMVQGDGGVAEWLQRDGQPDYFEVSSKRVRLLYIDRDQVVELSRSASGGVAAQTTTPIRASDHTRFRDADRARLGQTRVSRVPAAPAAVEEERPNQVLRARVGERAETDPSEPPAGQNGDEPKAP